MYFVQLRVFLARSLALSAALCALLVAQGQSQADPKNNKSTKSEAAVGPTLAVLYFDYSGNDEEMAFLRKGLTQMLVTDLSQTKDLRVVDRVDLESVMQELKLNRSNKIDKATANRIGKLLGARFLITGGYFEFRGRLRVDAKVIDVETGAVNGVGVLEDSANFMELEAKLAQKLHSELRSLHKSKAKTSRKSAKKRRAKRKGQQRPKVMARTVARYGKALDAIDQGNKKVAMKALESITSETPYFKPAAAELKVLLR
jgi:TolB-like protein